MGGEPMSEAGVLEQHFPVCWQMGELKDTA